MADSLASQIRRNQALAASYVDRSGSRLRLYKILGKARDELNARIRTAVRLGNDQEFGAIHAQACVRQLRTVLDPLMKDFQGLVVETGTGAAAEAAERALRYIRDAEDKFRGIGAASALRLREAAIVDKVVSGNEASQLRRLMTSGEPGSEQAAHRGRAGILQRYGEQVVTRFEEQLQMRVLARTPWDETRERIAEDVRTQPFFAGKEPGQATMWAERIVRTETMYANNRANFQTIGETNEVLGDMVKILAATFDDRTGADSIAVHGQIRRQNEPFDTWYGSFMHPPDRPNDREIVVPHRLSWPIPDELKPRDDGEVLARWQMEGRKGSPPGRPTMTTIPLEQFGKPQPLPEGVEPAKVPTPEPEATPTPELTPPPVRARRAPTEFDSGFAPPTAKPKGDDLMGVELDADSKLPQGELAALRRVVEASNAMMRRTQVLLGATQADLDRMQELGGFGHVAPDELGLSTAKPKETTRVRRLAERLGAREEAQVSAGSAPDWREERVSVRAIQFHGDVGFDSLGLAGRLRRRAEVPEMREGAQPSRWSSEVERPVLYRSGGRLFVAEPFHARSIAADMLAGDSHITARVVDLDALAAREAAVAKLGLPRDVARAIGHRLRIAPGAENSPIVADYIADVGMIPASVYRKLVEKGWRGFTIGETGVADLPGFEHLRGQQPRGWGERDKWNDVRGVYSGSRRQVGLGSGAGSGGGVGKRGVAAHELGHALGDRLGFDDHATTVAAHKRLFDRLSRYEQQDGSGGAAGRQEFVAETVSHIMNRGKAKAAATYDQAWVNWVVKNMLGGKAPE